MQNEKKKTCLSLILHFTELFNCFSAFQAKLSLIYFLTNLFSLVSVLTGAGKKLDSWCCHYVELASKDTRGQ